MYGNKPDQNCTLPGRKDGEPVARMTRPTASCQPRPRRCRRRTRQSAAVAAPRDLERLRIDLTITVAGGWPRFSAWPVASRLPSAAQRMLSTRKPSGTSDAVAPCHRASKERLAAPCGDVQRPAVRRDLDAAMPDSLPGTFCHPLAVCHSHSSPFRSAFCSAAIPPGVPRGRKFVAMNPPSSSQRTEFRPIGSGATAQPIQVSVGVCGRASSVNTHRFAAAVEDDVERVNAIASFPQR